MIFAVQTQPIQIILCFSFGYLSGVVLSPFFALGYLSKIRVIKDICSFLELVFLTIAFVFLKNAYALGEFRAYMGIICLLGFYIYKKTLGNKRLHKEKRHRVPNSFLRKMKVYESK
jgi:hypothetical protein